MSRDVRYVSVPASVALDNVKKIAAHFAAGDGSAEQLDLADGFVPRRNQVSMDLAGQPHLGLRFLKNLAPSRLKKTTNNT